MVYFILFCYYSISSGIWEETLCYLWTACDLCQCNNLYWGTFSDFSFEDMNRYKEGLFVYIYKKYLTSASRK